MRLKYFCVTQILSQNITSLHMHACHTLLVSIDFGRNDAGPKRLIPKIGRNDPSTKAETTHTKNWLKPPRPKRPGQNDPGPKRPGFVQDFTHKCCESTCVNNKHVFSIFSKAFRRHLRVIRMVLITTPQLDTFNSKFSGNTLQHEPRKDI